MSCSFKSIQFGAFSLIKDAHSSRREADTVCDLHSQTSFALAALANHIHAHSRSHAHAHRYLFGRGFLFIQHRVLPGSPIQKALRTDATDRTGTVRGPRWALRRIGYAGCWCGAAVPACSGKGPFLSLWRWEAQGSTRSFISAGSLVGEWIPSGSCPHLQRFLGNQVRAAVTDYATAPLQLGNWDKWKELIAKRGCDLFSRSKLALAVHKWRMSFVASKISRLPDRGFW